MPPIVPIDENLLNAPSPTTPTVQGGAPLAPSSTTPLAPSATAPVVTQRRLTIFYQNGDTIPAAPVIDREVDIAQPILDRFAEYASERSQVNNIPVVAVPVQKVGFENDEDSRQPKYIDISGIPNAKIEFNSQPTQFPIIANVTPDPVGINYKNNNAEGPRNFNLNLYQKLFINTGNAAAHGRIVDKTLLATRGHNSVNKTVTPEISQDKNDGKITLGSYFYKNIGNNVNYVTGSYVRSAEETQTGVPSMTIEQMKNIGLNIMFEAVQGSAGLDYTVRSTDSAAEVEARMAIPSEQRIGKRVSLGRFTPAYQIQKLTGVSKPNNANFIDNTDDIQTYGSFYNVYSQFDSLISLGQIALCVAMILAFVILLNILTGIINRNRDLIGDNAASSFANLDNNEKQRLLGVSVLQDSGVYPLSKIDGGDIASQFLGTQGIFSYTRHRTEDCLNAGIQEFFGFSFFGGNLATTVTAGQQAANASLKVLTESGRLNVILRELLRSGITLVENTALDFTGGPSIAGIGNLFRKIRDLKIVRFINVLLGIGDKIRFEVDIASRVQSNIKEGNPNNSSLMVTGSNVSYVDSLPDNRYNYISKSRLSNQNGLIWSNKNAGMLNLPLFGAANSFGNAGFETVGSSSRDNWRDMGISVGYPANYESSQITGTPIERFNSATTGRIDPSVVKAVEDELESDFMPFYIHDLRTNEILSFHAFLEEASEDFNVEYTSQDGYGRMDKVQIYKSTTRNVSVNFKMVAMNPEDHDIMWYKVNRLAMMIYPQWTQGRKITVDNLRFIQPFSQIPGATPVIRLRLGDLFKSNYSKMAVARLFGISTLEDYNVDSRRSPRPRTAAAPAAPAAGGTAAAPAAPAAGGTASRVQPTRAEKLQEGRVIGTSTQEQQAQPRRRSGQRRNASSVATYAVGDLFAPGDEVMFVARSFPNIANYRTTQGIIRSDSRSEGRIFATIQTVDRDRITVRPVTYFPDFFIFNEEREVQNLPQYKITQGNTNDTTITINQLNSILDRSSTVFLLQRQSRRLENQATSSEQQSTQQQSTQQQSTELNLITPQNFYDENQNPVMKAFNSSGGKGLAGVITSFKIDYGEAKGSWGIDSSEFLRAPMFVTVQLQMAVIHDITPGLDAKGIMMAPIWPVGKTSNHFVNNGTNPPDRGIPASPSPSNGPTSFSGDGNDYFSVDKGDPLYYNRRG
jgi:hypothetical protein